MFSKVTAKQCVCQRACRGLEVYDCVCVRGPLIVSPRLELTVLIRARKMKSPLPKHFTVKKISIFFTVKCWQLRRKKVAVK